MSCYFSSKFIVCFMKLYNTIFISYEFRILRSVSSIQPLYLGTRMAMPTSWTPPPDAVNAKMA
uniref:Uncharacterized protein n=1 Tax=Anopheles albimanus TaxID=7167 RepID=A0A182FXR5_ANOAL